MRTPTPPLAPDQQPHDVTVYIVLNDFGQLGRAYVETDEAAADERTVANSISAGETCVLVPIYHRISIAVFALASQTLALGPQTLALGPDCRIDCARRIHQCRLRLPCTAQR